MVFGRKNKRAEIPKSVLGSALYRFDLIYNSKLKYITDALHANKSLHAKKTNILIQKAFADLDRILENISIDHFKTDYRSDKIRTEAISMIHTLKQALERLRAFDAEKMDTVKALALQEIHQVDAFRQQIRLKMKEIESDYC